LILTQLAINYYLSKGSCQQFEMTGFYLLVQTITIVNFYAV